MRALGRRLAEWIVVVAAIFTGTLLALVIGIPLGGMASDWLLDVGWWPVSEAWP